MDSEAGRCPVSISGSEATMIAGIVGGGSAVLAAGLATLGTYGVTKRSVVAAAAEGERQRTADADQRQRDRVHAWDLAAEERRQTRRRDAYVTIQVYVSAWSEFAQWRIRRFETDPPIPVPIIPSIERETTAAAELLASPDVVAALTDFTTLVQRLRFAMGSWESAKGMAHPGNPASVEEERRSFDQMEIIGQQIVDAGNALGVRMRGELFGEIEADTQSTHNP